MINISNKISHLLTKRTGPQITQKQVFSHYVQLLEEKDQKASVELELLEEKLHKLNNSCQEVELQIRRFKKSQNVRTDIIRHLSSHDYLL